MANTLTTNPRVVDTGVTAGAAVTVISSPTKVHLIQWLNSAGGEVADGSLLTMTINGASVDFKAQGTTEHVPYEASFPMGMNISSMVGSVMDKGILLVWTI